MGSRNIPFPVNCSLGAGEDLILVSHCISPWLYLLHPLVHETDSQPWFCAQLAHSGPHQPMIFAASSLLSPPLVSVMNFFFTTENFIIYRHISKDFKLFSKLGK